MKLNWIVPVRPTQSPETLGGRSSSDWADPAEIGRASMSSTTMTLLNDDHAFHGHCRMRHAEKLVLPGGNAGERYHVALILFRQQRAGHRRDLVLHRGLELGR